jgi:hypothetical protein
MPGTDAMVAASSMAMIERFGIYNSVRSFIDEKLIISFISFVKSW